MDTNKKNSAMIREMWSPVVEKLTEGLVDAKSDRMGWICEVAHNQHINEAEMAPDTVGGVHMPISNLQNTLGIGNAVPASMAAMTGADQSGRANMGSGDKWPSMLPLAVQVAARTIALDLVNVHPLEGPTGVLPFMDYVYSDSKNPYGATPSYDASTANPMYDLGGTRETPVEKPWSRYSMPSVFRCKMSCEDASMTRKDIAKALREDASIEIVGNGGSIVAQFIGYSRLSADPMFRVIGNPNNISLGTLFEGETCNIENPALTLCEPRLISMLEDQILGYAGSGQYDGAPMSGTFENPFELYEPMDRATGEIQYPRHLSLQVFTKFIQVGKIQVAVAVTREQVSDLQKQWGIDVLKMVENGGLNELTQHINKHILSRLFAHGWRNHIEAYEAEGINLNLSLVEGEGAMDSIWFAYNKDGQVMRGEDATMKINKAQYYGAFENMDTKFSRVSKLVKTAGNVIMQRSRRGPATFVVTNQKVAALLQDSANYTFAPMANTFNQTNGNLYPVGTVAGMTVYVDPYMRYDDTRVLVGRKGAKDEPGVFFCPYLMAESVNFIDKDTFAPKVVIQSRYALVDAGWYPYLSYLTLFIDLPEQLY